MFDPLIYLLFAVLFMAMFFGTVPLAVAVLRGDKQRIDRILDLYIEVFAASAAAIIGALRIFRRKSNPPELPTPLPHEDEQKKLPRPEDKQ